MLWSIELSSSHHHHHRRHYHYSLPMRMKSHFRYSASLRKIQHCITGCNYRQTGNRKLIDYVLFELSRLIVQGDLLSPTRALIVSSDGVTVSCCRRPHPNWETWHTVQALNGAKQRDNYNRLMSCRSRPTLCRTGFMMVSDINVMDGFWRFYIYIKHIAHTVLKLSSNWKRNPCNYRSFTCDVWNRSFEVKTGNKRNFNCIKMVCTFCNVTSVQERFQIARSVSRFLCVRWASCSTFIQEDMWPRWLTRYVLYLQFQDCVHPMNVVTLTFDRLTSKAYPFCKRLT